MWRHLFVAIAGGRSVALAIAYGLGVGVGFLASPVVESLGVGLFGREFGWHFAATVLVAHAAYVRRSDRRRGRH